MLWLSLAHGFSPVQISVEDRNVTEVVLKCPDRTVTSRVVNGIASFSENVSNCAVEFKVNVGRITDPGAYTCGVATGCTSKGVNHRAVDDAEGRVNIILTDQSANLFELKCGSWRERSYVTENVAVFENVPSDGCTLHFKGGTPTKADGIGPGTYKCSAIGGVGSCRRR